MALQDVSVEVEPGTVDPATVGATEIVICIVHCRQKNNSDRLILDSILFMLTLLIVCGCLRSRMTQ